MKRLAGHVATSLSLYKGAGFALFLGHISECPTLPSLARTQLFPARHEKTKISSSLNAFLSPTHRAGGVGRAQGLVTHRRGPGEPDMFGYDELRRCLVSGTL